MAQAVECPLCEHEALISNPSVTSPHTKDLTLALPIFDIQVTVHKI
jgi:hypothetical protein